MSVHYEQLALDGLLQIGAATAHAQLDSLAQQAAAAHCSYSHFLGRLLEPEIAARRQRVVETCVHFAGLPWMKRLSDFDFTFQPDWLRLHYATDTKIRRHLKIKARANPFDPEWSRYFEERALLKRLGKSTRKSGKSVVDTGPDLPGLVMA